MPMYSFYSAVFSFISKFDPAAVLFGIIVVAETGQNDFPAVICQNVLIPLFPDLADGSACAPVPFQLDHQSRQTVGESILFCQLRIAFLHIGQNSLCDHGRNLFQRYIGDLRIRNKAGDVQIDDMIPVQVLLIRRVFGNCVSGKQFTRITGPVIVGAKHPGRIGFPESAGSADTGEVLVCPDRSVDQTDQAGLVNIP